MHLSIGRIPNAGWATMACVAFMIAGCGGDDAGSSSTGGLSEPAASINEVLVGIQDDFVKLDGDSYCDRLTAAGQRQVERFGKAFGFGGDCTKIIDTVARNTRATGIKQKPSKLVSVKVKGDRAVATIRNGGRPAQPMVFVNEGGDWKIPDPGFSTTFGGKIDSKPLSSDPDKRLEQVERARDEVKGTD